MASVAFHTLGCKVNSYESEGMLELFKQRGYTSVDWKEKADVYVINTCTVTNTGDAKSRQMIRRAKKENPDAIIAVVGCYAQVASGEVAEIEGVDIVIGTKHREKIVDYIEEYKNNHKQIVDVSDVMKLKQFEKLNITSFENRTRAFMKIQDGCNNFCTYCIIPYARGGVRSRAPEDVLRQAQELVNQGFVEIVLTGIHTAGYGMDLENYSFSDLLRDLSTKVEGLKRIRISSIEMSQVTPEIINLIATSPVIVDHLHIPIQSGTDETLRRMARHYTTAEFEDNLNKLKKALPTLSVTTDVIVGFPGETEEDFEHTYNWIKKCHFNQLHVFPYSKRSGTPAATMANQVPGDVKKERVKRLMALSDTLKHEFALSQVGKTLEVLFEEEKDGYKIGHASNYLRVKVKDDRIKLNHLYDIKIIACDGVDLLGKIIMKRINELFDVEEDFKILSLHSDSRYVGKDSIFFCVEGLSTDGHKYADDAVFQGAKCIVHSKPLKREYRGVLYIQVNDVLAELNRVANIFYDYPSYKMTVFGVTGTSGKTIVSLMIKDVLGHYIRMGYVGTNDSQFDNRIVHSPYTTPEPIYLHRTLNEMVKSNVKGVALEVSSYGLTLHRVDSIDFDVAIFTNLYPENLDLHGTMDNLMRAYAKLFERLDEKNTAILNADSVVFNHFLQTNDVIKAKIITYGIEHRADIMAHDIREYIDHTEFILLLDGHMFDVSVPILGGFNVPMVLALIAALKSMEMPLEQIIEALGFIKPIDGRMELLDTDQPFDILIDYCAYIHSYENIFKFARKVKRGKGRIIAVFGPSGTRSEEKEIEIARLANNYCDQVILTEQDGRIDNVQEACEMMQNYISKPVSVIITNRRIAISQAVELACKDDIILILGKGHEQFMASSLSNTPYPGDKYVAKSAIDAIFKGGNEDEI